MSINLELRAKIISDKLTAIRRDTLEYFWITEDSSCVIYGVKVGKKLEMYAWSTEEAHWLYDEPDRPYATITPAPRAINQQNP